MAPELAQPPSHVALLASPGMGHLIPFTELAKRLTLHHGLTVTLITTSTTDVSSNKATQFFNAGRLPPGVTSLVLPPVDVNDITQLETRIIVSLVRSLPSLRDALIALKTTTRLVTFAADIFGIDSFEIARELGVPAYLFYESNFMTLSFMFNLPELDAATTCEYRDLPEPLRLPGCVPISGKDFPDPFQDRKAPIYSVLLNTARKVLEAEGVVVNSFEDIEPGAAEALREGGGNHPPVYPVGPLTQTNVTGETDSAERAECLQWLDRQPKGSVVFISFGSGGTLSSAQLTEFAAGLEASGQRFLWVVRKPNDGTADGAFFSQGVGDDDPLGFLPDGFVERTKEVGMVLQAWAPQIQVLAHEATGGFLTHCGWNSTLESIAYGVPMIAWPLYAEQKMNAVMLVEGVMVALRAEAREDGMVSREEIARVVRELMVGEQGMVVCQKVVELQAAGVKALSEEGSSYQALNKLIPIWND